MKFGHWVTIRPSMAGTVRRLLTPSWRWAEEADKRQQGLLLPIKGDMPGQTQAAATAKRRRA